MIEIVNFRVEDALEIWGSNENVNVARLNQIAGPCFTAKQGKKILGCGGVRIDGVGEPWALISEDAKNMKKELLRQTKSWLEVIIRNHSLQRLWSDSPIPENENFIRHLGFEKVQAYLKG